MTDKSQVEAILKLYKELGITNALEFLAFFDDDINSGKVHLYNWQQEALVKLSGKYNALEPLELAVCAVNGSGKDKYVIAPLFAYKLCTAPLSRGIITSASSQQIMTQTEPSIRRLVTSAAKTMKEYFSIEDFVKVNQKHFQCEVLESEVKLFATDEPGRAEGFHPWTSDSEMILCINEAKSVPQEIFEALTRCTGYNIWLEVSSPGAPVGHFYEAVTSGMYDVMKVTAAECGHISERNLEKARRTFGENSPIYKSMKYAEFTSMDSNTVFSLDTLNRVREKPPTEDLKSLPKRCGIDMAAGGDEDVVSIWQGNKRIAQESFRCPEPADAVFTIISILQKYGFTKKDCDNIYMDDGGLGRACTSLLYREGWEVRRILNQSPATYKKEFGNRGMELWHNFSRLVAEGFLILPGEDIDPLFWKQIRSRQCLYKNGGKLYLESKADAKAHGRSSPDRVDAAVLAHCGVSIEDLLGEKERGKLPKEEREALEEYKKNRRIIVPSLNKLLAEDRSRHTGGLMDKIWGRRRQTTTKVANTPSNIMRKAMSNG